MQKGVVTLINIKKKSDCSGCHACVNICPKKCIVMKTDDEGFWYPAVDLSQCVKCGLCQRVCHHLNAEENHNQPEVYACYTTDEDIRMHSSSGGMFTLFAEEILNRGGAVFGAAFDDDLTVKHIGVTRKCDLVKLQGSKYVQSCIGDTYASAKEMLQKGTPVLFTGTPCQIGGLKLYLGKQYHDLYTADVVCHGAPSPKVWKTYLEHLETQSQGKIDKCDPPFFREKTPGWIGYSVRIRYESGEQYCTPAWKDSYMGAFTNDLTLRPSCYYCEFKGLQRNSDLTMADFWGVDKLMPNLFDNKGTSLIFIHSDKGRELFESIRKRIVYQTVSVDEAIKHNPSVSRSAILPFKRKKFMANVNRDNFTSLYQACVNKSWFEITYHRGKRLLELLGGTK